MSEFLKMMLAIGVPFLLTMLLLYVSLKSEQRPPQTAARAKVPEAATAALVVEAADAREGKSGGAIATD